MSKSQALVVRSSTDLSSLDELDECILTGKRVELLDDPETIQRQILEQLLGATSDEELEPTEPTGWRELAGVPIEVRSFSWRPSDYDEEGSSSVFVVVFGINLVTGEPVTLTTGARNVLAQLSNLARRGRFPIVRAVRESEKETKRGYRPLWLYTPDGYVRDEEGVLLDEEDGA
jgi:hypothetical protein